jgi:nucleotide-binding universal stress UspA family protein
MSCQVVVAFNLSAMGPIVLDRAIALACSVPGHVLHVVTVIDPRAGSSLHPLGPDGADYRYADAVAAALGRIVEAELAAHAAMAEVHCFVHARIGTPAEEILNLAREVGAEKIIMGIHDVGGVRRFLMGSTARAVVRDAECTVTVVRDGGYPPVKLLDVVAAPPHEIHRYVPPHRYSYSDGRVVKRPLDWPLF